VVREKMKVIKLSGDRDEDIKQISEIINSRKKFIMEDEYFWIETAKDWFKTHKNLNDMIYKNERVNKITSLFDVRDIKILEVGSGSGIDSIALAKLGASCYCLDNLNEMLNITRKLNKKYKTKVKLIKADCNKIPFKDNTFDFVFSAGVLEHFKNPIEILKEEVRVLKKYGFLLVDVPNRFSMFTLFKTLINSLDQAEFSYNEIRLIGKSINLKPFKAYGYQLFYVPKSRIMKKCFPSLVRKSASNFEDKLEISFAGKYICSSFGVFFMKC
jgi:ubiquinone/menaquinone biosynthesis C-methylase UbiE